MSSIPELAEALKKFEGSLDTIQARVGGGKGAAIRQQLEEIKNNAQQFQEIHQNLAGSIQEKCQGVVERSEATIKRAQAAKEAAKKLPPKPAIVFPPPKKALPMEVDPELGDRLRDQLLARFGLKPKTNGMDGLDWKEWLSDHQ